MPFEVRIGATKWDRGENIDAYNRLSVIGREFGFSGWLRESTLISLIEQFGEEKTEWGLRRLHGKGNYSLDTLVGIIEGSIPAKRNAPIKEMGRTSPSHEGRGVSATRPGNTGTTKNGPRSVADFLDEHPPIPLSGNMHTVRRPEGAMTLPEVNAWLTERSIPVEKCNDYFRFHSVGVPGNIDFWVLLPTHLHPKNDNENNDTQTG